MNGNITYHQQVSYCGKPRCRRCREGIGHGPYWYAYHTENGRTIRTYIGKHLPSTLQGTPELASAPTSTALEPTALRIRALGQFLLERKEPGSGQNWQAVRESAWQQQRVRTLLACLISSSGRKLGREQVIDALWPEVDVETGSSRLDRSVYSLRQILEPGLSRTAASQLLRLEREVLILADQAQIWIDADAFEHLLARAYAADDTGAREKFLEEAAVLYGGDFLSEERHADWAMARREALQRSWMGLLLELADLRITRGALVNAIEPLDRLLAADPLNEAAVQRLIISLAHLERRGEALRAYHRFAEKLQSDYNLAPLAETRTLYEAVQQGDTQVAIALTSRSQQSRDMLGQRESAISVKQGYKVQIGRSHQSPLIGRDNELALMRDMLDTAAQNPRAQSVNRKKASSLPLDTQRRPQCILLVGEAGIGKTRLAEELSHEAQKRGWAVAWSRVYAQESSVPYRQWTEVLRGAMTHGLWQKQELSKHPLFYQPLTSLLPELHETLPQAELPTPQSPEQEQLRLWEATLELLTRISERNPLLIVLDDFHWADASSSELFAYLVRRLQDRLIVLLGTYRDNELPASNPLRPLLTDLHREQVIVSLALQPLTNEQIASLVAPLPGTMVQYIQAKAAGNPFFAEELARSVDAQSIAPGASNFAEHTGTGIPLPDTIAAVLELRMSRLSSACQRLLSNASVFGGSFTFPIICQMEASGATNTGEDTILDLVEEALQAGVLTEEGAGTRISYHFWHPLLVSHLYDQLSAARRARFHRRAAEVLQRTYQGNEEEGAATITNHLVEGGADPQQIAHYAGLAADRAYSLSAYPEAERYYLIAVNQLEESIKQQPASAGEDEQSHLAYLLERLAECTRNQGNYEEARHLYERVLDARSHQPTSASQAEYQQETQIDALLWCEIGQTWYDMGEIAHARQCYEHGEEVLRKAGVTTGSAWASLRFQMSRMAWQEGNYKNARRMANEALHLYYQAFQQQDLAERNISQLTSTERTLAGDQVNLGRTYMLLGGIANSVGGQSEALDYLNTALPLFEQYNHQRDIASVCCNLGDVYLKKAEHELAYANLRRSLSFAERLGDVSLMSVVFSNMGVLAIRFGDLKEAERLFKQSLLLAEQINDQVYVSLWNVVLATVLQDQNELSEAEVCIRHALSIGRAINNAPCIGFALVTLGKMHIVQAMIVHIKQDSATQEKKPSLSGETKRGRVNSGARFLKRAQRVLERAVVFEELEAEARIDGLLALTQVFLLLDDLDTAWKRAVSALEEARQYKLTWESARAQSLMGKILTAKGQQEQAEQYFEQAIQVFRQGGMRLEYARTLQSYGAALLQHQYIEINKYKQGLSYLREAHQIFNECHAALDRQMVERILARCQQDEVNIQES